MFLDAFAKTQTEFFRFQDALSEAFGAASHVEPWWLENFLEARLEDSKNKVEKLIQEYGKQTEIPEDLASNLVRVMRFHPADRIDQAMAICEENPLV